MYIYNKTAEEIKLKYFLERGGILYMHIYYIYIYIYIYII